MKFLKRLFLITLIFSFTLKAQELENRKVSVELHLFESLLGNYGLTTSIRLNNHVSLSLPLEFYHFGYSLPGGIITKVINKVSSTANGGELDFTMLHLRGGLGVRIFFLGAEALDSGLYIEPIIYGGWIRNTDFSGLEFKDTLELIDSFTTAIKKGLSKKDYISFTPQVNIGYQWVSEAGILLSVGAFLNYVVAPSSDTVFAAAKRFFEGVGTTKSKVPASIFEVYRLFLTQMPGFHTGIIINFGLAF